MDDARKSEIERLAGIAFDKQFNLEQLGIMAMPHEPEKRRKAAIEYAVAKAEAYKAEEELEAAKRNTPKKAMYENS